MDYGYAIGAIKARETSLLDKTKLSKLFRCSDEEFRTSLVDMGYGSSSNTVEGIITSEMLKTKKFLETITPESDVMELFYLQNDAQNTKVIYKAKTFGLHNENYLNTGVIDTALLAEAINSGNYDRISDEYAPLLKKIAVKTAGIKNARVLSATIDNCFFEYIFDKLEVVKEEALAVYFGTFVNLANILTLIRCQTLNWGFDKFSEMYLDYGSIKKDDFLSAYSLAGEGLAKHFIKKDYGEKISKCLKDYVDNLDLSKLEKSFDELKLKIMKDYSLQFSSVGPLVYYYLEKEAEAKNIRLIYSNHETDVADLLSY
jgi:vacuolar-type H+-ATPase subunit C/Vma6